MLDIYKCFYVQPLKVKSVQDSTTKRISYQSDEESITEE